MQAASSKSLKLPTRLMITGSLETTVCRLTLCHVEIMVKRADFNEQTEFDAHSEGNDRRSTITAVDSMTLPSDVIQFIDVCMCTQHIVLAQSGFVQALFTGPF